MGRGIILLGVALALGIFLLNKADTTTGVDRVNAGTHTTQPDNGVTTTTGGGVTTTTVPVRSPDKVKILVANGTDVRGAAGRVNLELVNLRYNPIAPVDFGKIVKASQVYFQAGFEREAAVLVQALGLPQAVALPLPVPPPLADLHGADILIILGPDLAAKVTTSSTSTTKPKTTTTTAKSATTTTAKPATTTSTTKKP